MRKNSNEITIGTRASVDLALKVRGDSLAPFIRDGDITYIHEQNKFEDGDLIVVRLEDGYTLKQGFHYDGGLMLDSFSCTYPPLFFSAEMCTDGTIEIVGVLVGFERTL